MDSERVMVSQYTNIFCQAIIREFGCSISNGRSYASCNIELPGAYLREDSKSSSFYSFPVVSDLFTLANARRFYKWKEKVQPEKVIIISFNSFLAGAVFYFTLADPALFYSGKRQMILLVKGGDAIFRLINCRCQPERSTPTEHPCVTPCVPSSAVRYLPPYP